MKKNQILLSGIILMISITACQKYSDGPLFDIKSKTERVANNWKVAQALDNGVDVTSDYNQYELNLKSNGDASLSAKYSVIGIAFEFVTDGTWVFVNDNERISFDFDNNDADALYKILKLKENEMWIEKNDGTLELHLVTQ